MSGAVVPNDWDGTSFRCVRVVWPDSEQYRAILLGQMSVASVSSYFDPLTGDAEQAALAVESGVISTTPNLWALDCDANVLENVKVFVAEPTAAIELFPNVWTHIQLTSPKIDNNLPGFDFPNGQHIPGTVGALGQWLYEATVSIQNSASLFVRLIGMPGSVILRVVGGPSSRTQSLSLPVDWTGVSFTSLRVEALTTTSELTEATPEASGFSGVFLGLTGV